MKKSVLLFAMICSCVFAFGENISGSWNGQLTIQSKQLNLVFLIAKSGNTYSAILDSPDQDNFGIQVRSVNFDNSVLKIELANSDIQFIGKQTSDGSFEGVLIQSGMPFSLQLNKQGSEDVAIGKMDEVNQKTNES